MSVMELEQILGASETCIHRLKEHNFTELLELITDYSGALDNYLRAVDILKLNKRQQILLSRINDNHTTIMDIIDTHKRQVRQQIDQLRKGRLLQHTYHGG